MLVRPVRFRATRSSEFFFEHHVVGQAVPVDVEHGLGELDSDVVAQIDAVEGCVLKGWWRAYCRHQPSNLKNYSVVKERITPLP
jgi:hypothetical protein